MVSDLRQFTVALFKMSSGLPKHLRPTVAGRIEQHSLDAWLGARHFALTTGVLKSKHVGLLDQALVSIDPEYAHCGIGKAGAKNRLDLCGCALELRSCELDLVITRLEL